MKRYIPFLFALPLILGQGCAKPVIEPAGQTTQPQAEQPAQPVTQQQPVVPSPTPEAAAATPIALNATQSFEPTSVNTPNRTNLSFPGVLPASETTNKIIRIKTAKGDITFALLPDQGPNAASNYAYLVKNRFYDGLIFHRVISGFMAQGGDPQGTGMGGPGYQFSDDPVLPQDKNDNITSGPYGNMYKKGTVAMANAGPNTNGSQFFIMTADYPLDPNYTIFGRVISGQDVVDSLKNGDAMQSVTIESR
jgi:cyclophilin family peptidyl-prolyl cis-trans isomerase